MKQSIKIGRDTLGRINMAFSYNPVYIEKVEVIKDYKWHPKEKTLELPIFRRYLKEVFKYFLMEKNKYRFLSAKINGKMRTSRI